MSTEKLYKYLIRKAKRVKAMKTSLNIQNVIADIEFELMQETIMTGDLGEGIQQIKSYQNQMRRQLFDKSTAMVALEEIAIKQFQINDILITLLQEVVIGQRELTRKFEIFGKKRHSLDTLSSTELVEFYRRKDAQDAVVEERETVTVKSAMADDLSVQLTMQPTNVPLISSIINYVKIEFHNIVLFYLRLFAKKQVSVNQVYGDWLLYLNSLNRHNQEEIDILREQFNRFKRENFPATSPDK